MSSDETTAKCQTCGLEIPKCKYVIVYHSVNGPNSGSQEEHITHHKHPRGANKCEQ